MAIQKKSLISNRTVTTKAPVGKPEVTAAKPTPLIAKPSRVVVKPARGWNNHNQKLMRIAPLRFGRN